MSDVHHERITHAAFKYTDGRILTVDPPLRHHDIFPVAKERGYPREEQQGFWTSEDRFVDRKVGFRIASHAGQIVHKHGQPDILFSEDMW